MEGEGTHGARGYHFDKTGVVGNTSWEGWDGDEVGGVLEVGDVVDFYDAGEAEYIFEGGGDGDDGWWGRRRRRLLGGGGC